MKVEIKFHLGQMAGHAIETEIFNLKICNAQNFMDIAERFGLKVNYTQMVQLLALLIIWQRRLAKKQA